MNILVVTYIFLSAITCNYALNKIFKKNKKINILLSLIYSISPFTVYMYQIIRWMYFLVLFPLFILSLKKLLEEERGISYLFFITYFTMLNIQFTYGLLLFTIISVILYIFNSVPKEQRKRKIINLGIYTLLGLLISGVISIPNITNIFLSERATRNINYISIINTKDILNTIDLFDRIFLIFNPLTIAIIIKKIFSKKIDLKDNVLILIILLSLTAIFSPSNSLWHMGTYMCFPVRYSYIITFLHTIYIGKYLNEIDNKKKLKISDIILIIISSTVLLLSIVTAATYNKDIVGVFDSFYLWYLSENTATIIGKIYILLLIASITTVLIDNKKIKMTCASILIIIITFINLYNGLANTTKFSGEYEYLTHQEQIDSSKETIRVKVNNSYNANSSLINRNPSLAGFLPSGSKVYFESNKEWGYGTDWIVNSTTGGTILSDSLLRIQRYNNYDNDYPKELYKELDNNNFESNYIFPFGILIDDKINEYNDRAMNLLHYQDILAKEILKSNIFEFIQQPDYKDEKEIIFYLEIDSPQILYLQYIDTMKSEIYVNKKYVKFEKTETPTIVNLGYYENEQLEIKITKTESTNGFITPTVAKLDVAKYKQAVKGYNKDLVKLKDNKIKGKINLDEDKLLFIQIPYIEGWKAKVNGKDTKIVNTAKGYIGIELKKGINNVELVFYPKNLNIGIIASIIGLVLLVIIIIFKEKIMSLKQLQSTAYYTFLLLAIILSLLIYIIPLVVSIYNLIF